MYSIKNALLIQQDLPSTEVNIFYIDIRAFGKNYEQFFRSAKDKGINFIKAKPVITGKGEDGSVLLRYEDQEGTGTIIEKEYDMVVLCLGMISAWNPKGVVNVPIQDDGFMKPAYPKIAPTLTDQEGVFIAGVASGPKDIVDTIIEAGAAATEAVNYLISQDQSNAAAA
jgi:heterodisulfide reductase subunit A